MVAVVQLYTDERRNGKICRARRASRRARISRATRSSPHSGLRSVSTVLSSPGYRTSVDEVKLVPNNLLLENLHEPERNRTREARTGPERTGPEDKSRSHPWEDRSQPRARRPRPRLKPRPRAP